MFTARVAHRTNAETKCLPYEVNTRDSSPCCVRNAHAQVSSGTPGHQAIVILRVAARAAKLAITMYCVPRKLIERPLTKVYLPRPAGVIRRSSTRPDGTEKRGARLMSSRRQGHRQTYTYPNRASGTEIIALGVSTAPSVRKHIGKGGVLRLPLFLIGFAAGAGRRRKFYCVTQSISMPS